MLDLVQVVCPLNLACRVIEYSFASVGSLDAAKVIIYGVVLVVSLIRSVVVEDGEVASEYSTGHVLVLEAVT